MKTPREILLDHHRHAVPNLDLIREACVKPLRAPEKTSLLNTLFVELILPCRKLWTGLAVTWMFIIAVQVATGSSEQSIADSTRQASSRNEVSDEFYAQLLAEQRRFRDELLGIELAEIKPVDIPKGSDKRSELKRDTVVC